VRIGALQLDVRSDDAEANLRAAEAGVRAAAERGAKLLVLPEMWPTSFPDEGGADGVPVHAGAGSGPYAATERALARLASLSRELELVLCGSAYDPGRKPGERPANRLHTFDGGRNVLAYDKVHLFSPTAEGEVFRAGDAPPPVADSSAGRIGAAVCYDLRFPELTRVLFRGGAELLLVPAQWPAPRAAHFRALAIGRAVENQCFVVAANRTGTAVIGRRRLELAFPGNSLVVDPSGAVLAEGTGAEALVLAEIDLGRAAEARRRVPVARDERRDLYRGWSAEL
jgi:predicted amidohydrolase